MESLYSHLEVPRSRARDLFVNPWSRDISPILLLILLCSLPLQAETLTVGAFSSLPPAAAPPPGWELLTFPKIPRHTRYRLVREGGVTVVRAQSRAAAAALIRRIEIDPRRTPIVRWRWKIGGLIEHSDIRRKDGDDYPARLYLTFAYDPEAMSWGRRLKHQAARLLYGDLPAAALNYVWARRAAPGTIIANAYTDFTRMIVVASGPAGVGRWHTVERNVREDFRRVFGREPPLITGVAIMTDTDDTGASAEAWYGDITFHSAP